MASTIGERLRKKRIDAGFETAKQAAEAYGWGYPTYRAHENGTREPPKESLLAYASAFGCSVSWLLTGREDGSRARKIEGQVIPILTWDELPNRRDQMSGVIAKSKNGAITMPMQVGSDLTAAARVQVTDLSMVSPDGDLGSLHPNDWAILDAKGRVAPGKTVVYVDPDKEKHLRKAQVLPGGKLKLVPLNPDYPTFECSMADQALLGVVVGVFRDL